MQLRHAARNAFADFLELVKHNSDALGKVHERIAAFLTAQAAHGRVRDPSADRVPELCPVEPDLWDACRDLMARWAATLGQCAGRGADVPGDVYQWVLTQASRKKHGIFYTPQPLARFLVEQALDERCDEPPRKILDPSCGNGRFLLAAFRLLRQRFGLDSDDILSRLYGIEPDPFAAALARSALVEEAGIAPERASEVSTIVADALVLQEPTHKQPRLHFEPAHDDGWDASPADMVVGNPPYGARLQTREIMRYKQHYELAQGKFDIVSLFVELAGEALATDGVLAYVMPHSFTRSGGYAATREWLLARGTIRSLVNIGRGFPEIDLNTCAIVWRKGPTKAKAMARGYDSRSGQFRMVGEVSAEFYANRRAWPVYVTPENLRLARHMEIDDARPLESLGRIRRGATVAGLTKLLQVRPSDHDAVTIVRGRNIRRYGSLTDRPMRALSRHLLPQHALKGILAGQAAVWQNIGDRIKATLCPPGLLPLDTVNVLECDDPALACYLVAYMNSALVERYARDMILNRATLTVHFDRPTLGSVPVRVPSAGDLAWYERTVPMLIEEQDPALLAEVETRLLDQYEIDEDLISALSLRGKARTTSSM